MFVGKTKTFCNSTMYLCEYNETCFFFKFKLDNGVFSHVGLEKKNNKLIFLNYIYLYDGLKLFNIPKSNSIRVTITTTDKLMTVFENV